MLPKLIQKLVMGSLLLLNIAAGTQPKKWIVAADVSGNYKTVQAALDAVPLRNKKPVTILIKPGIYREKLHLDSSQSFVTLIGEDEFATVLTWDDHTGKKAPDGAIINTMTSASFVVKGNNFKAFHLTFANEAGFTAGQAVGLEVQGDKAYFKHCRIIGNQDILFTSKADTRQYYEDCYIEGSTDFIFGPATAWFEHCHIHSKKNSHVTAASTPQHHKYGYIFNNCILTGDTALAKVSLGRPWRPYAAVAYLHCYVGPHIMREGWAKWNGADTYALARFAEYKNYGPGTDTTARVEWSRQLNEEEVRAITVKTVLGDWVEKIDR